MPICKTVSGLAVLFLAGSTSFAALPAEADDLHVVASIKPIHSLVAAVMQGVGEPALIVKGAASPHTYTMKPSDAAALSQANVVFWTGHDMEKFMDKPLASLSGKATTVALLETPAVVTLKPREGGTFEPHDHGGEAQADHDHAHEVADHHDHEEEETDPHFWLDPENARAAVKVIAATLSAADPSNTTAYSENAARTDAALAALETRITDQLAPYKDKHFVVFHDAYQYFEKRFGLNATGSVTVSPDVQPGAARVAEIQKKIRTLGAVCIFSEPQFEPKLMDTIASGTKTFRGELDPEGATLEEGVDLYPRLLQSLADNLQECLSKEA
ncbi:zinc ABC transporter substrate-binding protein ZnuA [Rhizobium sp. C1]|uniref:zinc ABC transporter substrate-binding protein ZnuA n=1 Tax=Rhizobium sp. C1 TaxID=1349799 RepID=UPI001E4C5C55|nr:zinc ABC transporter substrate-binding protein ZnuA [Rhizobium sp. C1]MCD2176776.1 zinc ABC transporter substrate-binding protein ZnuA [Rhizobium sp. C1]